MKQFRFVLAVFVSALFVIGCDDDDEPPEENSPCDPAVENYCGEGFVCEYFEDGSARCSQPLFIAG